MLGNDVVFIVLGMTLECSQKRVEKRHGDIDGVGDFASKLHKFYAPAGEDEPNSYNVSIEQGMSRDDVLAKVIDVVNKSQSWIYFYKMIFSYTALIHYKEFGHSEIKQSLLLE